MRIISFIFGRIPFLLDLTQLDFVQVILQDDRLQAFLKWMIPHEIFDWICCDLLGVHRFHWKDVIIPISETRKPHYRGGLFILAKRTLCCGLPTEIWIDSLDEVHDCPNCGPEWR